jgi:response regulator RpfG family c-di-GMP phosphodiesterase
MHNLINKHSVISSELQTLHAELYQLVSEIIKHEHKIIGKSDMPFTQDEEINEYAQIIALADMFEALTHTRPYRDRNYTSVEALKIIIENKNLFTPRIIKAFLERVGMYPRGTFVELNTKEIAQVMWQNPKMPLCPMVRVIYDHEGKKIDGGRQIDLSQGTRIYISKSL